MTTTEATASKQANDKEATSTSKASKQEHTIQFGAQLILLTMPSLCFMLLLPCRHRK